MIRDLSTYWQNGDTSWSPAFSRAISACVAGDVLELDAGTFSIAERVIVDKQITIRGAGRDVTTISAPASVPVMKVTAANARVLNVTLRNVGARVPGVTGLEARAIVSCERVDVRNAGGHGFDVYGAIPSSPSVSLSAFVDCEAAECGADGWHIEGADASACLFLQCDARDNLGWGFHDASFLGNTFVACHSTSNTLGPYKATGASQRCLFDGCYSESGQPPSQITPPSLVVGGMHGAGVTGGALALLNDSISPHKTQAQTPTGLTTLWVGDTSATRGALLGVQGQGAQTMEGWWHVADYGGGNRYLAWRTGSGAALQLPMPGAAYGMPPLAPHGMRVGAQYVLHRSATAQPAASDGAVGDVAWHAAPVEGGPRGWQKVSGPNGAFWREL